VLEGTVIETTLVNRLDGTFAGPVDGLVTTAGVVKGDRHALDQATHERVRTLRHISRLQEPNRDALLLYARFIGDTADYVLNQTH